MTYHQRSTFITGHTGFKGSWLALWLQELGAHVTGYSDQEHPLFQLLNLKQNLSHHQGDINDTQHLAACLKNSGAEIVFHLAAQPLVFEGYRDPLATFRTNAMGTVSLLEAVRCCPEVKAVVIVTTDKVYENREQWQGYEESAALGGNDPYSASKAMAEMAVAAYRHSYFDHVQVATARAGNVIGGGDFAPNRLIPDIIRALTSNAPIAVRNPHSIRPWMYVLDALSGYLALGEKLLSGPGYAEAWNFGPHEGQPITSSAIVEAMISCWGEGTWHHPNVPQPPEMKLLCLNWEKAAARLDWRPGYDIGKALSETAAWYRSWRDGENIEALCRQQIHNFDRL